MDMAIYLFCLARAGSLPELHMNGLSDGIPVVTKDFANISAVVSQVPLHEYCGESAESDLQTLTWVGPRALRHAEIIEKVRGYSPVLPSRFGTLFSSVQSLQELLESNSDTIESFLDAVSGKDEWAVKVLTSRTSIAEKLFSDRLACQSEDFENMPPGLRYFKERQLRTEVEKEIGVWLRDILTATATDLLRCSADWQQRAIHGTEEEGEQAQIANWAFLVDREAEEDFRSHISRANAENNQRGLFFEVSGPWAPYSFTPTLKIEDEE
jgi:Gas vesicle synthesis protein GvpL/GvpF